MERNINNISNYRNSWANHLCQKDVISGKYTRVFPTVDIYEINDMLVLHKVTMWSTLNLLKNLELMTSKV